MACLRVQLAAPGRQESLPAGRTAAPPTILLAGWQSGSKHTAPLKETLVEGLGDRSRPAQLSRTAQTHLPAALLLRPHGFLGMCERNRRPQPLDKAPTASEKRLCLSSKSKLVGLETTTAAAVGK